LLDATTGEQVGGTDPVDQVVNPGGTCNKGFLVAPVLATQTSTQRAAALNACTVNIGAFTQARKFEVSTGIPVGTEPRYSVEVIPVSNGQLGQIVPHYRITAVGFGRNSQTKVTLEVLFRPI
jgi:Tfp pilus assembly protein PilX